MSQIETAVKASKEIESLLEARFGATGRGLHEKLESVQAQIPKEIARKARFIATIRNKLVHEHGFDATDEDFKKFLRARDEVLPPAPVERGHRDGQGDHARLRADVRRNPAA